ncbi:MAG: hypothetical protein ACREXS_18285, partial [Gammaproteobacteria bacterium]
LPQIPRHRGSDRERHFGATSQVVIHPGEIRDVTQIEIAVQSTPNDVTLRYRLGAEDMRPIESEVTVPKEEIETAIKSQQ